MLGVGNREPSFDHVKLAAALAKAAGQDVNDALPLNRITVEGRRALSPRRITGRIDPDEEGGGGGGGGGGGVEEAVSKPPAESKPRPSREIARVQAGRAPRQPVSVIRK